jgi:hypothetical protein
MIAGHGKSITAETEIQVLTPRDFPAFTPKPTQAEFHILNSIVLHVQDIHALIPCLFIYLFLPLLGKKLYQLQKSCGLKSKVVTCLKVTSRHWSGKTEKSHVNFSQDIN